jgi:hypothetical protein
MDTRDLLARAAMTRLPLASSPAGLSSAGTGSTKLRPNSYKTTKGDGISKKIKDRKYQQQKIYKGKYS